MLSIIIKIIITLYSCVIVKIHMWEPIPITHSCVIDVICSLSKGSNAFANNQIVQKNIWFVKPKLGGEFSKNNQGLSEVPTPTDFISSQQIFMTCVPGAVVDGMYTLSDEMNTDWSS